MKKLLALLSLATASTLAISDTTQPYDGASTYINVNTGIAKLYNYSMPTGEWTGNINAGYNFNRGIAVEAGYNIFAGSEFGASVMTNIFDVAAKGTIPLSNAFNLYGRAGLGFGRNSWSGTPTTSNCALCQSGNSSSYGLALVGLGGSFTLDKHWDLRLEDTAYIPFSNTYTGTIMAITFGTQYNF
jgi:hypothetical protein